MAEAKRRLSEPVRMRASWSVAYERHFGEQYAPARHGVLSGPVSILRRRWNFATCTHARVMGSFAFSRITGTRALWTPPPKSAFLRSTRARGMGSFRKERL
jgi:hypothetical protein